MRPPTKGFAMKFVVKHDAFNEVEVKLHWETKDKIKKVVLATAGVAVAAAVVTFYVRKTDFMSIDKT